MAAEVGIEKTQGGDGAPPPGEIEHVDVRKGYSERPKVEGGGGEGRETTCEIPFESGVVGVGECVEGKDIQGVDSRVPCLEKSCGKNEGVNSKKGRDTHYSRTLQYGRSIPSQKGAAL
jgi:hypothetical protein